jgi:hypothetical protein
MNRAMMNSVVHDEGYPIFVPDQILTSQDLNAVVDYCKSRSLLTRSQLIGQGIVRGLVVSADLQAAQITISAGVGISTDGQLIALSEAITLAYYENAATTTTAIQLFQQPGKHRLSLRQVQKDENGKKEVVDRSDTELDSFFQTHVLVVSCYPKEIARSAALLNYSAVGKDLKFELQFFLLPQDAVVASQDKTSIAPVSLHRFGYQKTDGTETVQLAAITTYDALKDNYATLCTEAIRVLSDALQKLPDQIKLLPGLSDPLPQPSAPNILEQLQSLQEAAKGQDGLQYFYDYLSQITRAQDGLQYFYDYLHQIAAAYRELADAVLEYTATRDCPTPPSLKPGSPALPSHLLLGTVQPFNPTAPSPLKYLQTRNLYRHHFISQPIQTPATLYQINRICYLYARLLRLCEADSFALLSSNAEAVKITPSADRTRPLSQQAIPYYLHYDNLYPYWNYDAYRRGTLLDHPAYSATPTRNPLTCTLDASNLYRIEGHLGQPHQTVLKQIQTLQQQYNLAFEVLALTLDKSESLEDKQVFHRFAETYPGLEHLGGVLKGGTFIVVYVKEQGQDRVVADFALPYPLGQNAQLLIDPALLNLSLAKTQFKADDLEKYAITVTPEHGTVEGQGILQEQPGQFTFQPSLVGAINQQLTVTITGKWQGRIRKTQTVTVYALPLAQFWLDGTASSPDPQKAVTVPLSRSRPRVALTPKNQGGKFRAFTRSETGEVNQDNLLQQNPPALMLSQLGDLEEFIVEYTWAVDDLGTQTSSITVQIHQDEDEKHLPIRLPFRIPTHLIARVSPVDSSSSTITANPVVPSMNSTSPDAVINNTPAPTPSVSTQPPPAPEAEPLVAARGGLDPALAAVEEATAPEVDPNPVAANPVASFPSSTKPTIPSLESEALVSQPLNDTSFNPGFWSRFVQLITKPIG